MAYMEAGILVLPLVHRYTYLSSYLWKDTYILTYLLLGGPPVSYVGKTLV